MNKKILMIIILGIVIITIAGFFYYKTSAVGISVPRSPSQGTKGLPNDFGTLDYSSNMIQLAEEKISEVEIKLNEAKEKDLSEFDLLHRKFLESMIDKMEDMLDKSKDNLDKAKDAFEEPDYFEASDYASLSRNIADIMPRHINNILEGRTKDEWNRLRAIETNE